jgi:hypothetical protein
VRARATYFVGIMNIAREHILFHAEEFVFHADYAEGAEPFGAIHDTNIPHGVGATLCRPVAP